MLLTHSWTAPVKWRPQAGLWELFQAPGHHSPPPPPGEASWCPLKTAETWEPWSWCGPSAGFHPLLHHPALVSLPFHSPSPGDSGPYLALRAYLIGSSQQSVVGGQGAFNCRREEVLSQPGWVTAPARLRVLKMIYSMQTEARALRVLIEYIYLLNGKLLLCIKVICAHCREL